LEVGDGAKQFDVFGLAGKRTPLPLFENWPVSRDLLGGWKER
jgi:hypothetical protein